MSEVIVGAGGASASQDVSSVGVSLTPKNTVVIQSEDVAGSAPDAEKDDNKKIKPAGESVEQGDKSTQERGEEGEETDGFFVGDFDMTLLAEEFQRDGKLSEESYKELAENGFPRELVDAYIRGVQQAASEAGELAKEHVDAIIAEVGGMEKFEAVMKWADGKLSQEEKDAYNKAATGKDPVIARLVVQGLVSRYEREYGHAPSLVKAGKSGASSTESEGFPDRSSMVAAMNDTRYGNDPEYTRAVEGKVLRSGLMRSGRRGRV